MAAGGVPGVSIRGSDELRPFLCSPCSRKALDIGAEVYCEECEEYFCQECLANHNSFGKLAAHSMLDRALMEATGHQKVQPYPTIPCDSHPSQVYTRLCKDHDEVCCGVCIRTRHHKCDVCYIADVSNGVAKSSELKEFKAAMKKAHDHLKTIKGTREKAIQGLTAEKDKEVRNINDKFKEIIKELKVIEQFAINDVNKAFIEFKQEIENDTNSLDLMADKLTKELDKLEKTRDETEMFIQMTKGMASKSDAKKLIENFECEEQRFVFPMDETMTKLQSLSEAILEHKLEFVASDGKVRVDTIEDTTTCSVFDMCLAEDGSLLLTDWENKCLKRLDGNYRLVNRLAFDNAPRGVCVVPEGQCAVTLCRAKTVQVLTLDNAMSTVRSFRTTDKCRSIRCHDNTFYVACGGAALEGEGHIAVFNISGTLLQNILSDANGRVFLSPPLGVAVSTDGTILVCDMDAGLVGVGQDGQKLWYLTCRDLDVKSVNRVCMGNDGQSFVSSYDSNKVVLVSKDGKKLKDALTVHDGVNKPVALVFSQKQFRLLVGMSESDQISIFKLT